MRKLLSSLCILAIFGSCKSSKMAAEHSLKNQPSITVKAGIITTEQADIAANSTISTELISENSKVNDIVSTAFSFEGTRYKFGGTTDKGMDCSGLVYTSFKANDIELQRSSYEIASQGTEVMLDEVKKGDLLFFNTNRKGKRINHVGLVVETRPEIMFIHATTSRGVLVSSLKEGYWNYAFIKATRIL